MMTEKETWVKMAEICEGPGRHSLGYNQWKLREDFNCFGLCRCLDLLLDYGEISCETFKEMTGKISCEKVRKFGHDWCYEYLFPTTQEGAKQRADFCREMALSCDQGEDMDWVRSEEFVTSE